MSLKQQIESKLNEALKAKDKNTYPTLRLDNISNKRC